MSRQITLKCRGRGTFANQTWLIHSKSVAEFTLVAHGANEEVRSQIPGLPTSHQTVLAVLDAGPKCIEDLACETEKPIGSLRRILADLIREGHVVEITSGNPATANSKLWQLSDYLDQLREQFPQLPRDSGEIWEWPSHIPRFPPTR